MSLSNRFFKGNTICKERVSFIEIYCWVILVQSRIDISFVLLSDTHGNMGLTGGNGFHIADYVVFGISMLISLGIGLYHAFAGGRQRTTSEYLMGDRKLKVFPTALSLLVTFQSSIMMLGYPAEIYVYGIMFWLTAFGFVITSLISTVIFIPLFHPLKMTSVYEVSHNNLG